MIPVRLELKNFLPYRAPDPIYFDGVHLACLTGANGAGKSSLLDAITWALWGRARARRDDDLVHLNQEEMWVQLDFAQEDVVYRVHRKRKTGKRGHGELSLFVMQADGTPHLINEPSMRATQRRIEAILRLDYETFVNSAFLQQGNADAFTTKTPAERKRILSDILGLEQWAVYEDRTKKKLTELDNQLNTIKGALSVIDETIAQEPQYIAAKAAAEADHERAEKALADAELRLEEVKDAPNDLRHARSRKAEIARQYTNLSDDVTSTESEIDKREQAIDLRQQLIAEAESIEAGYQTLQEARQTTDSLTAKLRERTGLDERFNQLRSELDALRSQLEGEQRGYQATLAEIERVLQQDSSTELAAVQANVVKLEQIEQQRNNRADELNQLREERSGELARKEQLTEEGQQMNERIATLEQADGATCPLCGQTLTDEHRNQLLADLTTERDNKRETYRQAVQRVQEIDSTLTEGQVELESFGRELAELPALRSRVGALQQQADDIAAARMRYDETQAALQSVSDTLANDDYGHALREQLAAIAAERDALGYDSDAHDAAAQALDTYKAFDDRYRELDFARKTLPAEQDALAAARQRLERLQTARAELDEQQTQLDAEIEHLALMEAEYHKRRQETMALRTAERQAYEGVQIADQKLVSVADSRKRKQEIVEQREQVRTQHAIYKELQTAFGKNGVPAMMIETAIPELETTANHLLSRMTNGRMHLRISTQREKVSGGITETLDIEIADELGTRPYEMYSGGEAFRVNFAIRVALSKMLARRAGAHLRTLFIDEGFGTQDDDGRNKLVEAITSIQDDFDLILVITHIEELRDAFPVHIVVEKRGQGSAVTIR